MSHHHEQRIVTGMTVIQVMRMVIRDNLPNDAVFDALPGEHPMIPGLDGEGAGEMIIEPVLSWVVEGDDSAVTEEISSPHDEHTGA